MTESQVLQAIERIESELARLSAEAAALRAHVSSAPPPAHPSRKETIAFPSVSAAEREVATMPPEPPPTARAASTPRAQPAPISVDTIEPVSRPRVSTRSAKARDTIPAPAASTSAPPEPEQGDDGRGGRYGFVTEPRTKTPRPK